MSKKRTEINPKRADRVKKIRIREGLTQTEFGAKIFQSQQNINRIENQKTALTENTAYYIISAFPKYRIEWLLGYDDIMLETDLNLSIMKQAQNEAKVLENALLGLARLSGFSVEPTRPAPDRSAENLIAAINAGYTFKRDGKSVSLSLFEMNDFENEICDYIEMRLKRMMK